MPGRRDEPEGVNSGSLYWPKRGVKGKDAEASPEAGAKYDEAAKGVRGQADKVVKRAEKDAKSRAAKSDPARKMANTRKSGKPKKS